jgi:hypothetical protein
MANASNHQTAGPPAVFFYLQLIDLLEIPELLIARSGE